VIKLSKKKIEKCPNSSCMGKLILIKKCSNGYNKYVCFRFFNQFYINSDGVGTKIKRGQNDNR